MKNQRIYTRFLLPDGDEIPLSFRHEKEIVKFQEQFPAYTMIFKDTVNPIGIKNTMSAIFKYNKPFRYLGVI